MVKIVDGLKSKLVEIDTQIAILRREIGTLEEQRAAFVKVITVYDPEFTLVNAAPHRQRSAQGGTASSRVTELLKGKNNRHVVLDSPLSGQARRNGRISNLRSPAEKGS